MYVILARNPRTGAVIMIVESMEDENGFQNAALYPTKKAARAAADKIPLCRAWPFVVARAPEWLKIDAPSS